MIITPPVEVLQRDVVSSAESELLSFSDRHILAAKLMVDINQLVARLPDVPDSVWDAVMGLRHAIYDWLDVNGGTVEEFVFSWELL